MSAAIERARRAVRHPKRGKAHRRTTDAYSSTLYPGSTVCGRSAFHLSEVVDVGSTDPSDRCSRCWTDTMWTTS